MLQPVQAAWRAVARDGRVPRAGDCYPHLIRSACFGAAGLAMLASVSGCVSSVDTVLQPPLDSAGTSQFAEGGPMAEVPLMTAEATSEGFSQEPAQGGDQNSAMEIAAVDIVPEPSPRNATPLLTQGEILAFSSDDDNGTPDTAPKLAYASVTGTPTSSDAAPAKKKKSFLELLLGHRLRKQADQITEHNANAQDGHPPAADQAEPIHTADEEEHEADGAPFELASLGSLGRLSPNGLRTQTDRVDVACLKPKLIAILNQVERHFGSKPIVTSGYRSPSRNQRAGGASKSLHIQCMAADIQVEGVSKWDLATYLRTVPGHGGVGTYCRTQSVHIDIGEERSWHYPCRRTSKRKS